MCDTVELKKTLAEKGVDTISILSEKTQINRNTLGRVLKGKEQPSSNTMYKLVSALELDPETAGRIFFKTYLRNT